LAFRFFLLHRFFSSSGAFATSSNRELLLFPSVFFFSPSIPYASDPLIDGWSRICNPGEESLCQSGGGVLFVIAYLFRTLGSKNDKTPVAARTVAASRNGSWMSGGGRRIKISFVACTYSKSKFMAPAPNTGSATARNIPIMSGATPLLLKKAKRAGGNLNLNG